MGVSYGIEEAILKSAADSVPAVTKEVAEVYVPTALPESFKDTLMGRISIQKADYPYAMSLNLEMPANYGLRR